MLHFVLNIWLVIDVKMCVKCLCRLHMLQLGE